MRYTRARPDSAPASRTVFKCIDSGKVIYSDSPCLGAEKLQIEPTRGANQTFGKERIGPDVRQELQHEQFVNALKPLTGLDVKGFDTFGRRMKLNADSQRECKALDTDIAEAESAEKTSGKNGPLPLKQHLLELRNRYRELRC